MDRKMAACFLKRLKLMGKWATMVKENDIAIVPIPMHILDVDALELAIKVLEEKEDDTVVVSLKLITEGEDDQ